VKKNRNWIAEHEHDEFVLRARRDGYRSRATYKLLEIDDKYRLLAPGTQVVDLGAAPGGWSQVASARVGRRGRVIALDLLEIAPIEGVTIIQGDFTEDTVLEQVMAELGGDRVDLVISDMAPNISGVTDIDQPRSAYLVELALDFATRALKREGALLAKCFEGEGIHGIRAAFKGAFRQVTNIKPRASRSRSREIYVLGRGFIGMDPTG